MAVIKKKTTNTKIFPLTVRGNYYTKQPAHYGFFAKASPHPAGVQEKWGDYRTPGSSTGLRYPPNLKAYEGESIRCLVKLPSRCGDFTDYFSFDRGNKTA